MTIWRMRIAWWVPKATNTHSEYVILIAFPLQQWLKERALGFRYTYIACIVDIKIKRIVPALCKCKGKGKGEVVTVHLMKARCKAKSIAALILNLGAWWR